MAYFLGLTIEELRSLPYEEFLGWVEYFRRRPPEWRADNRAAVIAMSFGGGKLKPQDMFSSLKTIQEESKSSSDKTVGEKFFEKFGSKFTEKVDFLDD